MVLQDFSPDLSQQYTIERASRQDLNLAVEWAAAESWNPGLSDVDCFYCADPQGFLIGKLNGNPIAFISAVQYGKSFGFIGFYIVRPEFRGQGYGIRLWTVAMESLGDRIIGLDGVLAQQANYTQSGFHLSHRNIRYEGRRTNRPSNHTTTCVSLISLPISDVITYDRPFFPDNRTDFLTAWITQSDHYGLAVLDQGAISGYGILRPCRTGYKMGPLFADTPDIANTIFVGLCDRVPQNIPFYLDVPAVNRAAVALAERYQMNPVFETARMYRGSEQIIRTLFNQHHGTEQTFGITTFELG